MSAPVFARVDGAGNLVVSQSSGVVGMTQAVTSNGASVHRGAYCFKLASRPAGAVASSIAHPDDSPFGPILYTAGPDLSGVLTRDENGSSIHCPVGFQDAAVVGRVEGGDGLDIGPGGFFVLFT
jgi:hypothetical protein